MTYDEVYEQICVGCIDEKKCHDECTQCDELLEALGEGE